MSVLVIAQHDNKTLNRATACAVTAARQLDTDVHILIAGAELAEVAEKAGKLQSVGRVLTADHPSYADGLAEAVAPLVAEIADQYTHVLAPATTAGKNILPRAAALRDCQPVSDVITIHDGDTFSRPCYAGSIVAKVRSIDPIKFLTVRLTEFPAAEYVDTPAEIIPLDKIFHPSSTSLVSRELRDAKNDLTFAPRVVSGGRGIQSETNFELLSVLAERLDAAIGASRGAVDAGFASNDMQVGQTGLTIAPDLYIAVGISGAIQHLAGMKYSKVIVAVNSDENAPIFDVADYGLVADLFTAVPELLRVLPETN